MSSIILLMDAEVQPLALFLVHDIVIIKQVTSAFKGRFLFTHFEIKTGPRKGNFLDKSFVFY